MGHGFLGSLLAWVGGHPGFALGLIFAIAVGESLFLFGLLIPGALFMFGFGALLGAGALPLGATFAAAIIGTLAGDGASYLLGRAYRGRLQSLPGLARFPGIVARGEAFFGRHGGKGVILGRLIGALRPIMPTVAGAAGLSPVRFVLMDIIATALWAPIYILPGVVFGASLDLAAQVATRLAILLLAVVAILWATTVVARFVLAAARVAGRRYAERLLAWSQRHRRLGLLGPALADPRQPELPALAVAAALLLMVTAAIYLLLWGIHPPRYPTRFDALSFYLTQNLHTTFASGIARFIAELGSPLIYLPFAGVIAAVLMLMGNWRAAGHWVAALTFSALVTALLRWWLAIPPPLSLFRGQPAGPLFIAGGGQDLILCATVYGLAGHILAVRQPPTLRPYYVSLTIAAVTLIALARLYLGLAWASDLLISLGVTFVWVNMLALCYRRQRPRRVRGAPVLGVLAGFVVIAALLALLPGYTLDPKPAARAATQAIPLRNWLTRGHTRLASRIIDMSGHASAPLNVQAAGSRAALVAELGAAGWHPPPSLDPSRLLRSLAPNPPLQDLPVLPRVHDGRRAAITLIHSTDGAQQPARWVLRLWPSNRATALDRQPLWVGLVTGQRIDHRLYLLTTAEDMHDYDAGVRALTALLTAAGGNQRLVTSDAGHRLVLLWPRQVRVDAKVAPD